MKKHIHGGDIYRHPGVLDFSANINPLGPPEAVIEAAKKSLHNIGNYPDTQAEELICALAEHENVSRYWLACANGAAELIFSLVWAVRPQKALLAVPSFAEYEQALQAGNCEIRYYDLRPEEGFLLQEDFPEELTPDLDIIFLCNPNNPTGLFIPPKLLQKIVKVCGQNQILLVLDECFVDFVEHSEQVTCKALLEANPQLFLLKAFTKLYAMPGLRLGYGICSDGKLLNRLKQVIQPWNVSLPAQAAGVAALKEENYVNLSKTLIAKERDFLKEELCKLNLQIYDSSANFVFFRGPVGLADKLLEKGIMIRDCGNYPGLCEGYYRIAVRKRDENKCLLEAVQSILLSGGCL